VVTDVKQKQRRRNKSHSGAVRKTQKSVLKANIPWQHAVTNACMNLNGHYMEK
jgi:hypothetical protein